MLSYNATSRTVDTRAYGDAQDQIGRPAERGVTGLVDPLCRMIGLHIYDGLFKIVPMRDGSFQEMYSVR